MAPKNKKIKKVQIESQSYNPPSNCTYSWPISYLQYKPNLYQQVDTVIENQIYTFPRFLDTQLCNDLIRWFTSYLPMNEGNDSNDKSRSGPVQNISTGKNIEFSTTKMPPRKDYAARVNDRAVLDDRVAARILWNIVKSKLFPAVDSPEYDVDPEQYKKLKEIFGACIGLYDRLRVYRYLPGHYFGQHYDEAVIAEVEDFRQLETPKLVKGTTRWTLLIYLTGEDKGEVEGGETVFYPGVDARGIGNDASEVVKVELEKGMMLLHKHGDDCLLHEGSLVKKGVKWVLRSDLIFPLGS